MEANTTTRHILPYDIQLCLSGKVAITNTRGETRYFTREEVIQTLARTDLDVHRRLMYEAARNSFPKTGEE